MIIFYYTVTCVTLLETNVAEVINVANRHLSIEIVRDEIRICKLSNTHDSRFEIIIWVQINV